MSNVSNCLTSYADQTYRLIPDIYVLLDAGDRRVLEQFNFITSQFRFLTLLVTVLLIQVFPNILAMVGICLMLLQIGTYIPFLSLNTHGSLT